jgi:hypothetical protein
MVGVAALVIGPPRALADFTVGPAVTLGPVVNSDTYELQPYISADGLSLYFAWSAGGMSSDILVTTRASVWEPWGPPVNLGPTINNPEEATWAPSISSDGLELYFMRCPADKDWMYGTLWVSKRATPSDPWGPPVDLGYLVPTDDGTGGCFPRISADGLSLFFGHGWVTHQWLATRPTKDSPWGQPVVLGNLASLGQSYWSCMSADGLALFFQSDDSSTPGMDWGIWVTTRHSTAEAWGTPYKLGPNVNDGKTDAVAVSADGSTLYFHRVTTSSSGTSSYDLWQAPIIPNCDFNRDGKVDDKDLLVLREHWGQNYSLCDIGPSPWGDGVVDYQDLKAFMKYAASPATGASNVPANVALAWVSPWFTQTHDVYLGTSFTDVTAADRDYPMGVLVSQGQTATTYDPPGLLEYGRRYFWRVDEVNAAPDSTIFRGDVMSFTVEPFSCPITKITATASSSSLATTGPAKTVDGSGLDLEDAHGSGLMTMWLSKEGQSPAWIQYEFDKVYALDQMWVWNGNQTSELTAGLGAKDVKVEYSTDGTNWTALPGVPQFSQATGQADYVHNTTVDFGGVQAKFIKLTILSNWGGKTAQYNLSEVRFFYVPLEHLMTPGPNALEVPCDVILSWMPSSLAEAYDVYFGASSANVASADRDNPLGVLVSRGQTAKSYDPAGLLEYGRTYYWRIDLVGPDLSTVIYKGPVLRFTTRAFGYPVRNVSATASSSLTSSMGPEKTIDGSGLDSLDQHGTLATTMWLSKKGQSPVWIQYEFDKVYALDQMWVWNSNQSTEFSVGYGAKEVKVEYSTDGTTWTALSGVPQFAQATGLPDYLHNTTVDFGGIQAKFVKLTIKSNWAGGTTLAGLSEVRFFYVPTDSSGKP